jgi:hypothetical protein
LSALTTPHTIHTLQFLISFLVFSRRTKTISNKRLDFFRAF